MHPIMNINPFRVPKNMYVRFISLNMKYAVATIEDIIAFIVKISITNWKGSHVEVHFLITKALSHTRRLASMIARTDHTGDIVWELELVPDELPPPAKLNTTEAPTRSVIPIVSILESFSLNHTNATKQMNTVETFHNELTTP